MGKKLYEVTERSFINGRLCEPGDRIELHIDSPGTNLREVGVTQGKMAPVSKVGTGQLNDGAGTGGQSTAPAAGDGYTAYHVGSGRYGIKDASGERFGEFVGTKEEAAAEAERLNTPDPDLTDQDDGLPDA